MRLLALLLLPAIALHAVAQEPDLVAKTGALSPADEAKKFKLPEGFTAQLVASEPDIQKPMQLAFDAKGRLWVTTSYHYPWAAEAGKGTDKLFVLSDFDANGKAKKVQVFDDKLNIPIGVLPLPDCKSVIVSECGKILKLTDTDGDMKADKREVLFEGFGFRDTHGMTNSFTLMPDGWVYACHGYLNDSKVKGKDGHEITMNSGNTFRFKPDGSRIEVYTRGQVNPFGMCVDPWLNLYTADCHSKPMTQLVRGAYYDSFGKPHDGLGYAPHVINHMHGSTGLCGLVYYAADHFPKEWNGVMFVGNCVTSRINCDRIEWKGSTPVGKELPDFLSSDDPWFRPVDLKIGPDGAMYVSDFYNKIIGHYEVDLKHPGRDKDHGRVWRIVYTGKDGKAPAPTMPRKDWTAAKDDELLADFAHPNTAVRLMAANEAKHRGEKFQANTKDIKADTWSAQAGMMAVVSGVSPQKTDENYKSLIGMFKAQKAPRDGYTGLLVRALTTMAEWNDAERRAVLEVFTTFDSPQVKRAVIDGMTAHPHENFVEPLLAFAKMIPAEDVYLRQATRIALRNCLDATPEKQRLPVGVLREKDGLELHQPLLGALMGCTDPRATHVLCDFLEEKLVRDEDAFEVGRRIGRYGDESTWVELSTLLAMIPSARSVRATTGVFRGLQEGGTNPAALAKSRETSLKNMSALALSLAQSSLTGVKPELHPLALDLYREIRKVVPDEWVGTPNFTRQLPSSLLADTGKTTAEQRLAAAEVALLYGQRAGRGAIHGILEETLPNSAARTRLITLLMANAPTTGDCSLAAAEMKTAPYTQALGYAVGLAGDKFGADLLLASIGKGEAPARLLQEKALVDRLKTTGVKDLDAKLKELTKNIPPAEKRVEDLLKARTSGFPKAKTDVAKGKAVFTKNCAICHQLNNEGAKVGPQLDGLGIRGLARLLEDTLDPNRNVDTAFRATKLELKDGKSLTGLVREDGAVYVLTDSTGKEQRIPAADVDRKTTTNLSAMPANLDTVMTEEEYYHLLAFLLEQKPKK